MKRQPTPLFILGSGRSGTTITASLLNRMPGIHIAKETGYIGQNIALLRNIETPSSLQRLISEVNSWLTVEQWQARADLSDFQSFCLTHGIAGASAFIHYVWQLESSTSWDQLEYIGDNTPLYVTCIPAILELMPNARFIHMVRDPRDVVCSIVKMRFGADDPVLAAMEWHATIGCWLMAERMIDSSRRIECHYESLCGDPAMTMQRIAGFLGRGEHEAHKAVALHAANSRELPSFGNVAGLPHHARLLEPLNSQRVGRYLRELTKPQIERIEEILQYGLFAYGYQISEWRAGPMSKEDRLQLTLATIRDIMKRVLRRVSLRRK